MVHTMWKTFSYILKGELKLPKEAISVDILHHDEVFWEVSDAVC